MVMILLHRPVASNARLGRIHLFPGRHLGEVEFDRMQAYVDERLFPLLNSAVPGILRGLEVDLGPKGVASEGFTVRPGLALAGNGQALGLYYPLRQTWQDLLEDYQRQSGASALTGVYYLVLRRDPSRIDAGVVDPCRRDELDPRRDTRRVVVGRLALRRLPIAPEVFAERTREQIENWVAADHVDGTFLRALGTAVSLALLAIGTSDEPLWLTQSTGRYLAQRESGYHVLLNQVQDAFRRSFAQWREAPEGMDFPAYLEAKLELDYLPAAGELPLALLRDAAEKAPSLRWLPKHLGIDMVPVPEEAIPALIQSQLPRHVVNLAQPSGDRLRLLLAINEPDFRRDLLDFPQVDADLEEKLYGYFMTAYDRWAAYKRQFDELYHLRAPELLDADEVAALSLPASVEAPRRPDGTGMFFEGLILREFKERNITGTDRSLLPLPYSAWAPTLPPEYSSWLTGSPKVPPPVAPPGENGLVIRHVILQHRIEAFESSIRATRTRLEKTRDYLVLMRQQLDVQTASLSALAGGVIGDGSGMQVARWMPYTEFKAEAPAPVVQATPISLPSSPVKEAKPFTLFSGAIKASAIRSFGSSLTTTMGAKSSSVGSNLLLARAYSSAKPSQVSAFEYGLAKERIEKVAELPKQPVTAPSFGVTEQRFGVLQHIRPEINEYKNAHRGMAELMAAVDNLFDKADAADLAKALRACGEPLAPDQVDHRADADFISAAGERAVAALLVTHPDATAQEQTEARAKAETAAREEVRKNPSSLRHAHARYHALFLAGQILTKRISVVESRYNRIEALMLGTIRKRDLAQAELAKLGDLIVEAQERLRMLDGRRVEALGDYGVAQRLVNEDWQRVERVFEERRTILTERVRGLYYVRVRPTGISAALPDPLELRHGAAGDIVPGCDWSHEADLPEAMTPFLDAVLDVPMDDWRDLRPLQDLLPIRERIEAMYALRKARLGARVAAKTPGPATLVAARLSNVNAQTQLLLHAWSSATLPRADSLKELYRQSARVLSLEDLGTCPVPRLRAVAQTLRTRLEQGLDCMLAQLAEIAPSIRLDWAQLAEDDRIAVEQVARWPGLERAEREDFNAVRTIAELVAWWFRQIDAQASANARAAMRNAVRAALITAAHGDPNEIVQGEVRIPPRRFRVGEVLRVKLTREAAPGTALQLLDPSQRVVGVLRVEDHDSEGTLANIVSVVEGDIHIDTRYSVLSSRSSAKLKH